MEYPEVAKDEAKQVPYPYVYVEEDGSVRELTPGERKYLETPFHPGDGARPYIKENYKTRGVSSMAGFCPRYKIPSRIKIREGV